MVKAQPKCQALLPNHVKDNKVFCVIGGMFWQKQWYATSRQLRQWL